MPPPVPPHFVRVRDEVRGPYDVGQLRDLAEAGVVSPATSAAVGPAGPWAPLDAHPERLKIFPPRREFAFKTGEAPPARDAAAAPVGVQAMIAAAATPGPVLRPHRTIEHVPLDAASTPSPSTAPLNEVQQMVRDVNERNAQFAPPPPPPPKRKMHRNLKLVLVLAVIGNSLLAMIPFAYDALGDTWSMVLFRGWMVLYNGALVFLYVALPKN